MLIVDNCVGSFGNQIPNGIPILPFDGDKDDKELQLLERHIRQISQQEHIVRANAEVFMLDRIRTFKDPKHYAEQLAARLGKADTSKPTASSSGEGE